MRRCFFIPRAAITTKIISLLLFSLRIACTACAWGLLTSPRDGVIIKLNFRDTSIEVRLVSTSMTRVDVISSRSIWISNI